MKLTPNCYVPSLRWRCGEYQALFRLSDSAKVRVVPFILIPEVEFDFEEWRPKKSVQDHVSPFAKRFRQKWGLHPAWIDVHPQIALERMSSGKIPVEHVFDELRMSESPAIPVASIDAEPRVNAAVATIIAADKRGVGLRIRLENLMKPSFNSDLGSLVETLNVQPSDVDLVVDLGAPNYEPYDDLAEGLAEAICSIADLENYRSFVLIGSAYPETIGLDKPGGVLPRHDWAFFKILVGKLNAVGRVPNYGDYTIVHPQFTPRDMRLIKAGGKLVYTSGLQWMIRKGGAYRDNPQQMHDHCGYIVSSGKYRGTSFSSGDAYIQQCASRTAGPSTLTRWKEIGISHHIMHVLDDLSRSAA